MNALTDTEREKLLTKLVEAPDDILLAAVSDMRRRYVEAKDDMKELNGFVGIHFTVAPKAPLDPKQSQWNAAELAKLPESAPLVLNNTTEEFIAQPPGPAAKRITKASQDPIMAKLQVPATAEAVNKFLGRGAGKLPETQALLKLLWDRGLIRFDGTNYRKA